MSKERSPNYPGRHLGEAIQDANTLYEKEGRTAFVREVAAKALGYKGFSGPSKVRIAALKQYGLLEPKGKVEHQLSERALTLILMNASHAEWKNAVRAAALAPPIFSELFHDKLSASDESIKHTLVVGKKFTNDGATTCIRVWRATMEFARLDGEEESVLTEPVNDDIVTGQNEGHVPEKGPLQVGDYVQWTSQGVDQFPTPLRITGFHDPEHAIVEGYTGGLPVKDLTRCASSEPEPSTTRGTTMSPESLPNQNFYRQIGSSIPVTPECSISIIAFGEVTQSAIERLRQYLKMCKPSFPPGKPIPEDNNNAT